MCNVGDVVMYNETGVVREMHGRYGVVITVDPFSDLIVRFPLPHPEPDFINDWNQKGGHAGVFTKVETE